MVKVICHKAASRPHTDGSVVFARFRQCTPQLVHSNRQQRSEALIHFEYIDRQICPVMTWAGPFWPRKLPFHALGSELPHLIHGSFVQPESTSQTASWPVQPLLQHSRSWETDRQKTDRPRYSVCSNRPHLVSASTRPKTVSVVRLSALSIADISTVKIAT